MLISQPTLKERYGLTGDKTSGVVSMVYKAWRVEKLTQWESVWWRADKNVQDWWAQNNSGY